MISISGLVLFVFLIGNMQVGVMNTFISELSVPLLLNLISIHLNALLLDNTQKLDFFEKNV